MSFTPDEHERIKRLEKAVYGNGQPGLQQIMGKHAVEFSAFLSKWEEREEGKKLYDDRQERRINTLVGIGMLALTVASVLIALLAYEHETHHALLTWGSDIVYAATQYSGVQ